MKVFKNKKNKKKILIAILYVVVVLVIVSLIYVGSLLWWKIKYDNEINTSTSTSIDTNPPTDNQLDTAEQIKKDVIEQEQSQTIKAGDVDIIISTLQDDGVIRIRTIIHTISSSGTCHLTASKDSSTITKESGVQALSSYSTCKGFDIPTGELSSGKWQLVVSFYSANGKGSESTEFTIK